MELDYVAIRALFPEAPAPDFQYSTAHKYIHLLVDQCEASTAENRRLLKQVAAMGEGFHPAITEDSVNERMDGLLARLDSLTNKLEAEAKIRSAARREVIDFLTESGHPDAAEAIAIHYREDSADE